MSVANCRKYYLYVHISANNKLYTLGVITYVCCFVNIWIIVVNNSSLVFRYEKECLLKHPIEVCNQTENTANILITATNKYFFFICMFCAEC